MRQVQAIIFDMDGVIVDSEPRHERAFFEVVREIGYGDKFNLRFADYIGRSDQELWVDFVAKHKPPQPLAELVARKRQRMVESFAASNRCLMASRSWWRNWRLVMRWRWPRVRNARSWKKSSS